jgi:hypothetical protein
VIADSRQIAPVRASGGTEGRFQAEKENGTANGAI